MDTIDPKQIPGAIRAAGQADTRATSGRAETSAHFGLGLLKNAEGARHRQCSLSGVKPPRERQLGLIDCRPNLYELLDKARPGPLWKRSLGTLREWLFVLAARVHREAPRNGNEN